MNEIQIFKFQENQVRVIEKSGEPWWVAKDIAEILEYTSLGQISNLLRSVPAEWKGHIPIMTLGGEQELLCILC